MAEVERVTGRLEEAVASGCEAIRLGLNEPAVRNNLGLSLYVLGRHAEAAGAFLGALDVQPNDPMIHANLGAALRALGENERALEHMRQAAKLAPGLAPARNNLGQFLLECGLNGEALGHCLAAVALEPEMAEAYNNLGNIYRALGHSAEARWCFTTAATKNPEMAHACVGAALTLQDEGRWDDALDWLHRATLAQPGNVEYRVFMAEALVDRERYREAIACYQDVIARDPESAKAHNALGWLLLETGELNEAERTLQAALALKPDLSAARLNLGALAEMRGNFAAAALEYRGAADDEKSRNLGLGRLALLLRGDLPDDDRQAMERQLESTDPSDPTRTSLLFGLAQVCDAQERYPQAAACAREANSLAMTRLQERGLAPTRGEHERFVTGLIEAFDAEYFDRLAGLGIESSRPVFIMGLPRSGTTLIEQILASHTEFFPGGELSFGADDFEAIPVVLGRGEEPLACIPHFDASSAHILAERHLERLHALDGGAAARVSDKMPGNYLFLGLLATLFPRAVFIHCRRDLRDVATSCWLTPFQRVNWTNDHTLIAERFQQYVRVMEHWRSVLPARVHEVDYEETIDNLEGVARRLVDACGLEWQPACLEFHKTSRPVHTASAGQVRRPVYRASIGRFKNYETELAELFAALTA
jgi:tetratricopeptide (TPR) repeat protein